MGVLISSEAHIALHNKAGGFDYEWMEGDTLIVYLSGFLLNNPDKESQLATLRQLGIMAEVVKALQDRTARTDAERDQNVVQRMLDETADVVKEQLRTLLDLRATIKASAARSKSDHETMDKSCELVHSSLSRQLAALKPSEGVVATSTKARVNRQATLHFTTKNDLTCAETTDGLTKTNMRRDLTPCTTENASHLDAPYTDAS
jgi:hypothetical protein